MGELLSEKYYFYIEFLRMLYMLSKSAETLTKYASFLINFLLKNLEGTGENFECLLSCQTY